jgi:hypothetical protein
MKEKHNGDRKILCPYTKKNKNTMGTKEKKTSRLSTQMKKT